MRKQPPVRLTGSPSERSRYSSEFTLGSLTTITVCHDYVCPWSYISLFQADRLAKEFGVTFDWRGFELYPPGMVVPPKPAPDPDAPPAPPTRLERLEREDGVSVPERPFGFFKRSHYALLGAEWALLENGPAAFDAYNHAVYHAYWVEHRDISRPAVLKDLASGAGLNGEALVASIAANRYARNIVPFDDEAYALGIRNLTTFIFGLNDCLAEASYRELATATERYLERTARYRGK